MVNDNESVDIFEFCRGLQAPIGHYSGNPRDFAEEATRDSEEMEDPLEAWGDDPDSGYWEPEFDKYVKAREQKYLDNMPPELQGAIEIRCAGQSHKDLGWRWRYGQTKRKTINTFRKAVAHAQLYSDYVFACSQPTLLEWTRDLDPALFVQIQEIVPRGQFDLVGGCMNECDCRIPSGESIVRQRLYGQLFYLEHFGRLSDVEWMPDTFGFANTLPQLFVKSGTTCFFTTKMGNNDTSPFPYTQFWWQSPDGSRVLSLFQGGGSHSLENFNRKIDSLRLEKQGAEIVANCESLDPLPLALLQDDYVKDYAMFEGAGDGRSGPTGAEVAEMRKMVEDGFLAGWTTAHAHFNRLKSYGDSLPTWADEIYYEYHRGTLSTQHLVKRMNRKDENDLGALEYLASMLATIGVAPYPYEELLQAWHAHLLMQFHDVLPGSSIPEVYDDCHDYWLKIGEVVKDLRLRLMGTLEGQTALPSLPEADLGRVLVFHPQGFTGVLNLIEIPWSTTISGEVPNCVIDASGNKSPVASLPPDPDEIDSLDRKQGRVIFRSPSPLPAMGASVYGLSSVLLDATDPAPLRAEETSEALILENSVTRVVIRLDSNDVVIYQADPASGSLESLAAVGNLHLFHERTQNEQCWNIQKDYRDHEVPIPAGNVSLYISPDNGLLTEATVGRVVGDSHFVLHVRLIAEVPAVFLELVADWHEHDATMRWEWTHQTGAEYSVTESPYGYNQRMTRPIGPHDIGRWELYGQSWADVYSPDDDWGFAIFNEGKYGFDARDDRLGQTILRGPEYPRPDSLWIRQERDRRLKQDGTAPPEFADQGTVIIRFGALIHDGQAPRNPVVNQIAHEINRPPIANYLPPGEEREGTAEVPIGPLFEIVPQNLELTAWKRAENNPSDFVIRLVEMGGIPDGQGELWISPKLASSITRIAEVDLLERENILDGANPQWKTAADGSGLCTFTIRKCEVVSLLLKTRPFNIPVSKV